jgi:hypothetical protein
VWYLSFIKPWRIPNFAGGDVLIFHLKNGADVTLPIEVQEGKGIGFNTPNGDVCFSRRLIRVIDQINGSDRYSSEADNSLPHMDYENIRVYFGDGQSGVVLQDDKSIKSVIDSVGELLSCVNPYSPFGNSYVSQRYLASPTVERLLHSNPAVMVSVRSPTEMGTLTRIRSTRVEYRYEKFIVSRYAVLRNTDNSDAPLACQVMVCIGPADNENLWYAFVPEYEKGGIKCNVWGKYQQISQVIEEIRASGRWVKG